MRQLPKKWCVKVTPENQDILSKWKLKFSKGEYDEPADLKIYVDQDGSNSNRDGEVITFEEFSEHYLIPIETKPMEQEIKEYRVKPDFSDLSKALFKNCFADSKGGYGRFDVDSIEKDFYKKAGVLDIWFNPVYQEATPEVKIKGYTGEINDREVKFGCQIYTKEEVLTIGRFLKESKLKIQDEEGIMKVYEYYKNKE
jgi:hypothetical protein